MIAAPLPSALPPLPPEDRALLSRFLALGQDATALAIERSEDLFDLIMKLAERPLAAWLAHIATLTNARRRELALHTLEAVCKSSPDPIEQRRAATRLLSRAIDVDRHPSTSMRSTTAHRSTRPHPKLPQVSPILTRPNPHRSAQETLATLINLLTTSPHSKEQARATLNAFFHLSTTVNNTLALEEADDVLAQIEHDPAFADIQLLDQGTLAVSHPPAIDTASSFQQTYTLTNPTRSANLRFTLCRCKPGWEIDAIDTIPP